MHEACCQHAAAALCWALLSARLLWPCMHCGKLGLVACLCCATGAAQCKMRNATQLQHHVGRLLCHDPLCSQQGLIYHKLFDPLLTSAPELRSRATLQPSTQLTACGLQEYEARWFFQQLIVALDYCHRLGVVSRDVSCRIAQQFCIDAFWQAAVPPDACFLGRTLLISPLSAAGEAGEQNENQGSAYVCLGQVGPHRPVACTGIPLVCCTGAAPAPA